MIETGVGLAAAALLAGASGFAVIAVTGAWPMAAAAAGILFIVAARLLASGGGGRRYELPDFAAATFENRPVDELLLTDELTAGGPGADELLLDDILAEVGADARVVRLFDPAARPTAGQMKANIDRHLRVAGPIPAPPDASQALHLALAELRQSLR